MIELSTLLTFVPAALVIISPGPDTLYVLTQSIKSGQVAGLSAGLGTASGVLVYTTGAVFTLVALLETSVLLYTIIKLELPLIRRAVQYANGSVLLGFGTTLSFEKRPPS